MAVALRRSAARATTPRRSLLRRLAARASLGLRARTAFALALGALIISVGVSLLAYSQARSILVSARRNAAIRQATANAQIVQVRVSQGDFDAKNLLDVVRSPTTGIVLRGPTGVRTSDQSIGLSSLPSALVDVTRTELGAQQLFRRGGVPYFGVAVSLRGVDCTYYEVESFADLDRSLSRLGQALAIAALLSTAAAGLLGRAMARRVLRPLREVADAGAEIASGKLATRLPPSTDIDLAPLLSSFNDMAASLEGRIEREARFAADVSHELRTPLTALATAAQLLQSRRDEMPERAQTALDVLTTQTTHFSKLVLDLLEISRYDAGAVELHLEDIDLAELARQVAAANAITVPIDHGALRGATVRIDKIRVERILGNLLQNARNYAGGATAVVLSDAAMPNGHRGVRIVVEDHGPGIADDDRQRVFERFYRGKGQRFGTGAKGTGLGLSLVAAHARLHGGRAFCEPRDGGGTRFVVELEAGR